MYSLIFYLRDAETVQLVEDQKGVVMRIQFALEKQQYRAQKAIEEEVRCFRLEEQKVWNGVRPELEKIYSHFTLEYTKMDAELIAMAKAFSSGRFRKRTHDVLEVVFFM